MNERPVFQEGDIVRYKWPGPGQAARRMVVCGPPAPWNGMANVLIRDIDGTTQWQCWQGYLELAVADQLVADARVMEADSNAQV